MTLTSPTDPQTTEVGPPPPFDPECAAALAPLAEVMSVQLTLDMLPAMQANPALPPVPDDALRRDGAFTVKERSVPGPDGAPEISLLMCRPTASTAPVPVVYNIHGGGMIAGDNRTAIELTLDWAQELELAVVSVEYRLAPGAQHPGPVEDCYAGLVWTAEHAEELGIDPARIIVAGGSAGRVCPPPWR
jgi:acetyl esterase/lipase